MLEELKKFVEQTLSLNLDLPKRSQDLIDGRIIFCLLALKNSEENLVAIGLEINKSHSTVVHYKKQAKNLVLYDKNFANKLKTCLLLKGKSNEEINSFLELNFLKKAKKQADGINRSTLPTSLRR